MTRYRPIGILLAISFILITLLSLNIGAGITYADFSDDGQGVVSDLEKDPEFDISAFPAVGRDYSLSVFQIAESDKGELFIYVYNPCALAVELTATSINMSLSESATGTKPYELELRSRNGVLGKYLVKGVTVSDDELRYYNITSIYRPWNKDIDPPTGNDNTYSELAYNVGKLFTARTVDGSIIYDCTYQQTVVIKNPYHGFIRYDAGKKSLFTLDYVDSHFVAFDTDLNIDTLNEADVSYVTQSHEEHFNVTTDWNLNEKWNLITENFGKKQAPVVMTVSDEQTGHSEFHNFWFIKGKDRDYKRIQSTEEFIKSEELDDNAQKNLAGTNWVLRFTENEYTVRTLVGGVDTRIVESTYVSEVTILRLKFMTAGKVYNLGAVSDKVTGSDDPIKEPDKVNWFERLCLWVADKLNVPLWAAKVIVIGVPTLVILAILAPVLNLILPFIGKLFKGLWWLLCLPFKGIAALIRAVKNRKNKDEG